MPVHKQYMTETEYVSHTVDTAHMRNIGEQSISNKIQAVLELVKNAYDGDALACTVRFYGGARDGGGVEVDRIVIQDSGIGMTKTDIKKKLMTVGTPNKAGEIRSPKFKRRVVGEKGMGHYSMQRLGTRTVITTTPEPYDGREFHGHDDATHTLTIDWTDYVSGKDLRSVSHRLSTRPRTGGPGTTIEITGLKDRWDPSGPDGDLQEIARHMGSMMLPEILEGWKHAFRPSIETVGFSIDLPEPKSGLLENAAYKIEAYLRGDTVSFYTYRTRGPPRRAGKNPAWRDTSGWIPGG